MPEPDIEIRVEGTPNPNAAKFVLDRPVTEGSGGRSYFDPSTVRDDALARRLFEIEGVRALLFVENFITVTKQESAAWDDLVERVQETIRAELGA